MREQRLKNEAVQVRVPKVQRERELAEQRSQREAAAKDGRGTRASDFSIAAGCELRVSRRLGSRRQKGGTGTGWR